LTISGVHRIHESKGSTSTSVDTIVPISVQVFRAQITSRGLKWRCNIVRLNLTKVSGSITSVQPLVKIIVIHYRL